MGRPFGSKYIKTAEEMFDLFLAYKKEIKENPIQIVEQKKGNVVLPKNFEGDMSNISTVKMPLQRPLTLEGFYNYLEDNDIITDATDYFENKERRYSDFIRVCARIRRIIRQDQIEGGMAGIYNPSITQRLNGLVEKQSNEVKINMPTIQVSSKKALDATKKLFENNGNNQSI